MDDKTIIAKARVRIKQGMDRDYLEIASQTNQAIHHYEKKTLLTKFNQDPNSKLEFIWLLVFKDFNGLISYYSSPITALYLANHNILGDQYELEIYGEFNELTHNLLANIGISFKFYPTKFIHGQVG